MREGLPGSVIEALALAVPIVATDIPAIRELVDDTIAALVPISGPDELARRVLIALAEDALDSRRTDAGRARFETDFTIQVSADRWDAFYRSVA